MPGKSLLIVLLIAVILTGCATSQLRVIPAPTEAPVQPTVIVAVIILHPAATRRSQKAYPTRIRMLYLQGNRNTQLPPASAPAGQAPYPVPAVPQAPVAVSTLGTATWR